MINTAYKDNENPSLYCGDMITFGAKGEGKSKSRSAITKNGVTKMAILDFKKLVIPTEKTTNEK